MADGGEQRFVISSDVVHRELDGETIVLSLDSGMYFGLNATGTRVWRLIADGATTAQICDDISREFTQPLDVVRADVQELIAALQSKGLVAPAPLT